MSRLRLVSAFKKGDKVVCYGNNEPGTIIEQRDDSLQGEEVWAVQFATRWSLVAFSNIRKVEP